MTWPFASASQEFVLEAAKPWKVKPNYYCVNEEWIKQHRFIVDGYCQYSSDRTTKNQSEDGRMRRWQRYRRVDHRLPTV